MSLLSAVSPFQFSCHATHKASMSLLIYAILRKITISVFVHLLNDIKLSPVTQNDEYH